MTTVLLLYLDGESGMHSVWIIDQDITQEQVTEAFPGVKIWDNYRTNDSEEIDEITDDMIIKDVLKNHGWTGQRVKYVEGEV